MELALLTIRGKFAAVLLSGLCLTIIAMNFASPSQREDLLQASRPIMIVGPIIALVIMLLIERVVVARRLISRALHACGNSKVCMGEGGCSSHNPTPSGLVPIRCFKPRPVVLQSGRLGLTGFCSAFRSHWRRAVIQKCTLRTNELPQRRQGFKGLIT